MTLSQRVAAFVHLGKQLSEISQNKEILRTAYNQNNWFTEKNIINAAQVWAKTLSEQNLFKSVLITGNWYMGKNASDDTVLMPYVVDCLIKIEPRFKEYIEFTERVSNPDAVIATGSNNTSR